MRGCGRCGEPIDAADPPKHRISRKRSKKAKQQAKRAGEQKITAKASDARLGAALKTDAQHQIERQRFGHLIWHGQIRLGPTRQCAQREKKDCRR